MPPNRDRNARRPVTPSLEQAEELIEELEQQAVQLEEQATELEAINEELSASEARLRGIIDSALDAIITIDADSVITGWNEHAEDIFGWSAEEAVGRTLPDTIIPPQYHEAHRRGIRHYLETGEGKILNQRIEITARHRDGHELPVELTVSPARWGNQVIFSAFLRDISERKRAEQLQAAQFAVTRVLAESKTVKEAAPEILAGIGKALGWDAGVFWSLDERHEVLRTTDVWVASPAEEFEAASRGIDMARGVGLPGRVWDKREAAWISDVPLDENFPRLSAAAQNGLNSAFGFPIQVGDDFIGVMEFFNRHRLEPDTALLATMSDLGNDIGHFMRRREAEELLEEREAVQSYLERVSTTLFASALDYEATLEDLVRLAVPTLADWCVLYVPCAEETLELRVLTVDGSGEVGHRTCEQNVYHPARKGFSAHWPVKLEELPEEWSRILPEDDARLARVLEHGEPSGMLLPLRARERVMGVLLLLADERPPFSTEDLSVAQEFAQRGALALDNAWLYADAQQANRAKADFLATMSHELRTPLNAMIGYTDLMEQGIPEPLSDAVLDYVRRVGLSARHLLQLIEEILSFTRLEAGRESVTLKQVTLEEILGEVRAIIEPLAAGKGLRFVTTIPDPSLQLRTDPRKLRQILLNLLGNAVKFTEQGEVEFSCALEGPEVVFRVRDTGVGIDPEQIERIFEPFWQVQQSRTRAAHGTGLGLSVTQRLVRLLEGQIQVESSPAEGSTFIVRLPRRE